MSAEKLKTKEVFADFKKELNDISDYSLAKQTQVSSSTLGKYANGQMSITLEKLSELASKMGMEFKLTFFKKPK